MKNNQSAKRVLCFLLSALLMAAMFTACGNSGTKASSADTSAPSASAETQPETTAETTISYDPQLPDADYDGYTFTFYLKKCDNNFWTVADIWTEELNNEVLNDAIYNRNAYIDETYNVNIEQIFSGDTGRTSGKMQSAIQKMVLAGDPIDAVISSGYATGYFALNGYLLDLTKVPNLDFSKPWWDKNSIESISLYDKVYFVAGELTTADNDAVNIIVFVKNLIDSYKLESPYQIVKDGKWTLDKLIEMSDAVSGDLDGDGKINENDRVGYLYFGDSCATVYNGAGNFFGIKNAEGEPELTFYTDRAVATWQKMMAFLATKSTLSMSTELDVYKGKGDYDVIVSMIEGQNTLFTWCHMKNVPRLRSVETDFGVIPNPMFDEAQGEYYSQNDPYGSGFLSIPVTCSDTDRAGLLLEAFSAKSMELVTKAYYDVTLQGKYMRDVESEEMLDLIFSTMTYDIGDVFNWGNLMEKLSALWGKENPDLASLWASVEPKATEDLNETIALFQAIDA